MNSHNTPKSGHNAIRFEVCTTDDLVQAAMVIRSIVYVGEQGMEVKLAFDGNDKLCTHIVGFNGNEPFAAIRVRFFCQFAKMERMAIRKEYRDTRTLKAFLDFVLDHIARKGYPIAITHAAPVYARLWSKLFGFKIQKSKDPTYFDGHEEPYYELVKELTVPDDAISIETDVKTLYRVEGLWDSPGLFEQSKL